MSGSAALLIASSGITQASYPAPTVWEAHDAFNGKLTELILSSREDTSTNTDITNNENYALDLEIIDCRWSIEPTLNYRREGLRNNLGYNCKIEVMPTGFESFVTRGFFVFDGYDWRYFGWLEKSDDFHRDLFVDHKRVKMRSFIDTPFNNTAPFEQNSSGGYYVDNVPWRAEGEGIINEDYFSPLSEGHNDPLLNAYERFGEPYAQDWQDIVERPKGTDMKNITDQ